MEDARVRLEEATKDLEKRARELQEQSKELLEDKGISVKPKRMPGLRPPPEERGSMSLFPLQKRTGRAGFLFWCHHTQGENLWIGGGFRGSSQRVSALSARGISIIRGFGREKGLLFFAWRRGIGWLFRGPNFPRPGPGGFSGNKAGLGTEESAERFGPRVSPGKPGAGSQGPFRNPFKLGEWGGLEFRRENSFRS